MKKTILIGALAAAFIVTGGTGLYMASAKEIPSNNMMFSPMTHMRGTGNFEGMEKYMEDLGVNVDEMHQYMENENMNFGQMKDTMREMHPNLETQELEEMYKGMHGTGGASQSRNFN